MRRLSCVVLAVALPEGSTTLEEGGVTYYQFDMVFSEEV
jgi:hypothetical protein